MCGSPWETDVAPDVVMRQDLQEDKRLMQEAGYDGRPVVPLNNTDNPTSHAMALVTQQLLTEIGVKVDLQSMGWGTLVSRRAEKKPPADGGWNLFMTSWIFGDLYTPAVNQTVDGSCDRSWFGWYCSEAMQRLRAERTFGIYLGRKRRHQRLLP